MVSQAQMLKDEPDHEAIRKIISCMLDPTGEDHIIQWIVSIVNRPQDLTIPHC